MFLYLLSFTQIFNFNFLKYDFGRFDFWDENLVVKLTSPHTLT